jgi:predicted transposase/invertase (TIGR01784 family)
MCLSNEVFINPFTDFGFKRIFGEEESKPFLISFLNDLLPIENRIESITFQNIEKFGATKEDRKAIYDLYCIDEKGNDFIVELQRAEQKHFIDRALYYTTFPIQQQATRGVWDFELKPIYFIGILNFEVSEFRDDNYIHYCQLMDIDTKSSISNKLNFIYIEIPKFKKKREELSKHLEYWLYFFRELNRLREIPEEFKGDILEDAFKRAEFLKLSSQEQHNYHINLKHYRDLVNSLDTALERGKLEGAKQEKIEIAQKLLDVLDIETISIKTGLSKEEIENLSTS